MAELKTKPNNNSVPAFIDFVEDEPKRKDCIDLLKMFRAITRKKPKLWGNSIIGFGSYDFKYPTEKLRELVYHWVISPEEKLHDPFPERFCEL